MARTVARIEPCPVCGKTPKVIFDEDAELFLGMSRCVMRCRRFLVKHLEEDGYGANREEAFGIAAGRWNRAARGK